MTTEPEDEVERLLRRTLVRRALDVEPAPARPQSQAQERRSGQVGWWAAAVAALVVVAAGVTMQSRPDETRVAGTGRATVTSDVPDQNSPRQAPTRVPREGAQPTSEVTGLGVTGARVVYGDRAFDAAEARGPSLDLGGPPSAQFSPIETPWGIVALVGGDSNHHSLWLRSETSEPQLLSADAAGFAVNADRNRVAWATSARTGDRATIYQAELPSGTVTATTSVDRFTRVSGYVRDLVLVTVGDGLSSVNLWDPTDGDVTQLEGGPWGQVLGTHPGLGLAVLTQGDGLCAQVARVAGRRATPVTGPLDCSSRAPARFSTDGRWLAALNGDSVNPQLSIIDLEGGATVIATGFSVIDTAWSTVAGGPAQESTGNPELFALTTGDKPMLVTCRPDLGSCTNLLRLTTPLPSALIARKI